jgi:hypothetical protein
MTDWLVPVRQTLDRRTAPIAIFIRDDDGGWSDARLYRLLDITLHHRVPIDLAIIPNALGSDLARHLGLVMRAPGSLVSVHQHGFEHRNHETCGRKSEFGPSRSEVDQRRDIDVGRRRLEDALGASPGDAFTPPWNRCTAVTARCLRELGFRLLSRSASAERFEGGLLETSVHLDWTGRHGIGQGGAASWGHTIAARFEGEDVAGIMLHHAVMDAGSRRHLFDLLALLSRHPMVRMRSMAQCASPAYAEERK